MYGVDDVRASLSYEVLRVFVQLILGAVMNTVSLIWLYRTAYWIVAATVWGLIAVSIKELMSLETIDGGTGVPQAIYKVEGVLYQVFVTSLGGLLLGSIQIA